MRYIIFILLFFVGFLYSQDSIMVSKSDWNYLKSTYYEVDSSLTECQNLNKLYDKMTQINRMEISSLRAASDRADSIIVMKDQQLEMRKDQIEILKDELSDKKIEIWAYRVGSAVIIVLALLK